MDASISALRRRRRRWCIRVKEHITIIQMIRNKTQIQIPLDTSLQGLAISEAEALRTCEARHVSYPTATDLDFMIPED